MAEQLTEAEKARCRAYLGYPNLENRAAYSLGLPVILPESFALEMNMNSIKDAESLVMVREILTSIEKSRCAVDKAKGRLMVTEIQYSVRMNMTYLDLLWEEDWKLCKQLSDLLYVKVFTHPTGNTTRYGDWGGDIPILD